MRTRRSAAVLGTVLVTALLAAGCGSSDSGSGSSGDTIKIGAWYPLTGAVAASGVPQRDGADAYFKMLNEQGGINGKQVEFIVKDNAYDAQQTVQIARDLIGGDDVVAIVGANGTAQGEATFPFVIEQSKVPYLMPLGGLSSWYEPPRDGLFGFMTGYEDQGAAVGAWAAEEGAKKIVVVHSDPAAFVSVASQVGPAAKTVDDSVTTELLPAKFGTTDFAPVVSQVKSSGADAVVTILAAPEAAAYLKEAELQGVSKPTYGYAPDASAALLSLAGTAAEGFHSVSLTKAPVESDPATKEFLDAMKKYYPDQTPDFIAMWGWAAAKSFAQVAKTVQGDITADSLKAAFTAASSVDNGVGPVLSFSADQHLGTRDVQRVTVKDGAWVSEGGFFTPPPLVAAG
ncbi:ABC transporter substrate-binding protein [Nakamurella sp. YIM 132087]|uniref:ABC transporter substrate-binding protein n=1 Tax=Nakamurella alba TaxID=2665158 RepID=A0A7K1FT26_9ACTN|nr:ABC transporter substrate-binding protein [Nakamurella alba]MTD17271.1 ABC transporter substrate-binding protein [Nakamurella alba]